MSCRFLWKNGRNLTFSVLSRSVFHRFLERGRQSDMFYTAVEKCFVRSINYFRLRTKLFSGTVGGRLGRCHDVGKVLQRFYFIDNVFVVFFSLKR